MTDNATIENNYLIGLSYVESIFTNGEIADEVISAVSIPELLAGLSTLSAMVIINLSTEKDLTVPETITFLRNKMLNKN